MNRQKIISILKEKLNLKDIYVTEDNNHYKITAIGNIFKGLTQVKRQQTIYHPLVDMITENKIHAISIKSYTLEEWDKKSRITYIKK
ncbi:BolA/IbaG family iron-sulfur metabolism protein [Buchnera aphidicola (Rhopalosiphum padi)]|uniref:BolA/IbaG family iron-sulfur metabolism protein n=1 Tax=Buchnera aphidicola subsp. Rhopalosiphum padi TaxID=98793 RepID=A0A4D6YHA6_BUCRP|nr:BolA/IbaG family iron-sulfur metabolism protein [Buchnera aphidicola]QCI25018.1 BolA/IbaG family iron-sulfur metabolism protein [Buchnera aphidicola (Rhopalosiphum padi)]